MKQARGNPGDAVLVLRRRVGFTLIELLVVIAIIAILAAILFPIFIRTQESARRAKCLSNLKQLGIAAQCYSDSYNENYPPARLENWPWGDWDIRPPWDGVTQPYRLGLRALNPYVKNVQVFFCPSNLFFKSPPYWIEGSAGWTHWAGYSYWGNYLGYGLTRQQIAVTSSQYPNSLLMSDIAVTYDNGSAHPFSSHWPKAVPEGGNYLYNDGHAKWKWWKQMRVLTSKEGVTFYW